MAIDTRIPRDRRSPGNWVGFLVGGKYLGFDSDQGETPMALSIGDAITNAVEGSVLFAGPAGVLAQDNVALFYDAANDALGVGTATPNTVGKLAVHPDLDITAVLGKLKIGAATPTADHAYLSHFDHATSATTWQVRLDPDGDTNMQAVGLGSSVVINSNNTTGLVQLSGNGNSRFAVNNTGIGFFGTTPTARSTGWTAVTNPAVVKTFDTATVTLQQLAQAWGTLQAELVAKGLLSV
jgi:hypothetical protein